MSYHQTTYVPKQTNHVLHLILTLITCGFWSPVWLAMTLINHLSKDKHTTVGVQAPSIDYQQHMYTDPTRLANFDNQPYHSPVVQDQKPQDH